MLTSCDELRALSRPPVVLNQSTARFFFLLSHHTPHITHPTPNDKNLAIVRSSCHSITFFKPIHTKHPSSHFFHTAQRRQQTIMEGLKQYNNNMNMSNILSMNVPLDNFASTSIRRIQQATVLAICHVDEASVGSQTYVYSTCKFSFYLRACSYFCAMLFFVFQAPWF